MSKMPKMAGGTGLDNFSFGTPTVDATPTHLTHVAGPQLPMALTESTPPRKAAFDGGGGNYGSFLKEAAQGLDWLDNFEVPSEVAAPVAADTELESAFLASEPDAFVPNTVVPQVEHKTTYASLTPAQMLRQAMRKSAAGTPLSELALPDMPANIRAAFEDEHPMAGTVFIRADAYPKCYTGKWAKHVAKVARQARFLVACSTCNDCVHAQEGRCGIFKKELVAKVPWDEAYTHYAARLRASGHKVASNPLDPKVALRDALVAGPQREAPAPSHTAKQDHARLLGASGHDLNVVSKQAIQRQAQWRMVQASIAKLAAQGLITEADAHRFALSTEDPTTILAAARKLASAPRKSASYQGTAQTAAPIRNDVWASVKVGSSKVKVLASTKKMVSAGLLTEGDVRDLTAMADSRTAQELTAEASYRVHQHAIRAKGVKASEPAPQYVGVGTRTNPPRVAVQHKERVPLPQRVLRWAMQAMSKGLAGNDLDRALGQKWSHAALKVTEGPLQALRQAHEGGAGFDYVSAQAWASPKGTTGCDKGAKLNLPAKAVLAMGRCSGCMHNSESFCNKYKKPLMASTDGVTPASRQANIKKANEVDPGSTASPVYSNDFGLAFDQSVNVADAPDLVQVGDVSFGVLRGGFDE